MSTPIKAAIYARCSDVKQAEKELSIPAQLDAARAEAKRRGWEVVNEYVDSGQTGRDDERAQFQEMMRVGRSKKPAFQRIIVWKFSRFMRNRYHSAIYKTQLRKVGVLVCSLHEPTEDTASGRLMEGIIEAFDEFYSENLAEDTSRGMRKNASLGYWNGGATPTGYRVRHTGTEESPKGVLEPHPETAAIVQRMFRLVLEGEGATSIRRELNRDGLNTDRGKPWSTTTVLGILKNPVYTGVLTFGKSTEHRKDGELVEPIRVQNCHPALVSLEDFAAVQALIESRTRAQIHPTTLAGKYLLSGLLHCANCGSLLIGHPAKSGSVHYYWCSLRMKCGPEACDGKLLNQKMAEEAVANRVRDAVLTEDKVNELIALTNAEIVANGTASDGEAAAVQAKLDDALRRLERLYASLETGALDVESLAPRIKQWKETVRQLEVTKADLAATEGDKPMVIEQSAIQAHVLEMRRLLDHGKIAARRAFLRAWIRRIEVKERTLTIEYTFPTWPPTGGGDVVEEGGEVEVWKQKTGRPLGSKGKTPSKKGASATDKKRGPVNAANGRSTPVNTGPRGNVLAGGEDGSPSWMEFELFA